MYSCGPCDRDKVNITVVCEAPYTYQYVWHQEMLLYSFTKGVKFIALCLFCLNIGVYCTCECVSYCAEDVLLFTM